MPSNDNKLVNLADLGEAYNALDDKKLDKDFSSLPTATTPYANTDLLALYRGGAMYNTDMQTLIQSAGGGGGTQQGALVNYAAMYSFSAANNTHTFTDANLTAQMVIVEANIPAGVSASLTPTISDGTITFTGTVSADCSITFYFGVGLAAAPTLLVNLGSNDTDNILKASPRPGVYGVLGPVNGGTGANSIAGAHDAIVFAPSTLTNNAAFHNAIPRGKNLGSSVTAAQWAAISAGTFEDMFIGDYWTINGVKYVIVDFDPYYRCGDNISLGHHIAVMPESSMASAAWNIDSNDTSKMYVGSDIRVVTIQGLTSGSTPNVDNEAGIQNTIFNAFGKAHVLKYRAMYPSAQSGGKATSWAWVDARVELLNEVEVYGTQVWTNGGNGNGYEIGINKRQLSIFRHDPAFCNIRASWWLRSVYSAADACSVSGYGYAADGGGASSSRGVRPFFLIG